MFQFHIGSINNLYIYYRYALILFDLAEFYNEFFQALRRQVVIV